MVNTSPSSCLTTLSAQFISLLTFYSYLQGATAIVFDLHLTQTENSDYCYLIHGKMDYLWFE